MRLHAKELTADNARLIAKLNECVAALARCAAERDEARRLARSALYELTQDSVVLFEDEFSKWDLEQSAPIVNRDEGDEVANNGE